MCIDQVVVEPGVEDGADPLDAPGELDALEVLDALDELLSPPELVAGFVSVLLSALPSPLLSAGAAPGESADSVFVPLLFGA